MFCSNMAEDPRMINRLEIIFADYQLIKESHIRNIIDGIKSPWTAKNLAMESVAIDSSISLHRIRRHRQPKHNQQNLLKSVRPNAGLGCLSKWRISTADWSLPFK